MHVKQTENGQKQALPQPSPTFLVDCVGLSFTCNLLARPGFPFLWAAGAYHCPLRCLGLVERARVKSQNHSLLTNTASFLFKISRASFIELQCSLWEGILVLSVLCASCLNTIQSAACGAATHQVRRMSLSVGRETNRCLPPFL